MRHNDAYVQLNSLLYSDNVWQIAKLKLVGKKVWQMDIYSHKNINK